jgi:hypothetical protein
VRLVLESGTVRSVLLVLVLALVSVLMSSYAKRLVDWCKEPVDGRIG